MGTPQPTTTVTTYNANGTSSTATYTNPNATSTTSLMSSPSWEGETTNYAPTIQYPASTTYSSSPSSPPPPPPPPAPILPQFQSFKDDRYSIKVAPRDTVVFDDSQVPIQLIQELLYEELGGVELANMSRTDLIDGQQVSYSAIANLLQVNKMYNPNNIVSSGNTDQNNFSIYSIDLLSRGINIPEFDIDGNIIIRIDDINNGELIEYQIALNGTIDRVDSI